MASTHPHNHDASTAATNLLDEFITVKFELHERLGIGWVSVVDEDGNESAMVSWIDPDAQAATKHHLRCGLVLGYVVVNEDATISVRDMPYGQILEQVKQNK